MKKLEYSVSFENIDSNWDSCHPVNNATTFRKNTDINELKKYFDLIEPNRINVYFGVSDSANPKDNLIYGLRTIEYPDIWDKLESLIDGLSKLTK